MNDLAQVSSLERADKSDRRHIQAAPESTASTASDLPLTVYTPASALSNPGKLLRAMLVDLWVSRELAWRLFVRDTSAQYRNSILGYVWVFIPPLLAALPFIYLNNSGVVSMGDTPIPYGAFAMVGTIVWQVFVDALNSPLKTARAAKSMLTRVNFPREAILLSGLMRVALSIVVRLILLVGVFAWFRIVPPPTALLFPVGVLALVLMGFVVGVLLTPVGLLYNDVEQTMPIFTTALLLVTPVLYPVPHSGVGAWVAAINPLTPLITTTRDWLTVGTWAPAHGFLACILASGLLLFVGWIFYRVALPHLVSRLGN